MKTNEIARQAIIAAVYTVVSLMLAPLAFHVVQFRFSEMLMILPFFNKKHIAGLTAGCLITNLLGFYGLPDVIFGTTATFLACIIIANLKTKYLIAPVAALVNGAIIGIMLFIITDSELALWASCLSVFIGEFVVVQLGVLMVIVIERSEYLSRIFK